MVQFIEWKAIKFGLKHGVRFGFAVGVSNDLTFRVQFHSPRKRVKRRIQLRNARGIVPLRRQYHSGTRRSGPRNNSRTLLAAVRYNFYLQVTRTENSVQVQTRLWTSDVMKVIRLDIGPASQE
jgi:hypothetical protein